MMMIADVPELHRAQRAFRSVLDAFARPGTVVRIERAPEDGLRPASLDASLYALTSLFIDQAVTFHVADAAADDAAAYLTGETHARRAALADADFVIVPSRADADEAARAVREARPGTMVAPDKGATVLMGCARVASDEEAFGAEGADDALHAFEVSGPGVKGTARFAVDRDAWALARNGRADEFPCGIDVALVDGSGNVVAVPRSSALAVLGRAGAQEGKVS